MENLVNKVINLVSAALMFLQT